MKQYNIFSNDIDDKTIDQFFDAMKQDFVIKGALMPDAHLGYSLPIGGVIATKDVIVPAWVGYDIGCGVCAYRTQFQKNFIENHKEEIFNNIYKNLPIGFNGHKNISHVIGNKFKSTVKEVCDRVGENYINALQKCGTLGGGNHFCEIGYDDENYVWIVIHSGSRHFGHSIASHYMKLASGTNKAKEGHYGFDVKSENGKQYIHDMNVALEYALKNRKIMIDIVMNTIVDVIGVLNYNGINEKFFINRNHNHAEYNHDMWIHRKGATHAEKDMLGVIPGNMKDGSFIVIGKGNPDSLWSSSHGAGRVLSRRKAKEQLNKDDFVDMMNGITAKVGKSTLDESPMAYKNIFDVMSNQADLLNVVTRVLPIINIKG